MRVGEFWATYSSGPASENVAREARDAEKARVLAHYSAMAEQAARERIAKLLAAEPIDATFKAGAIFSAEERAELMAEKEQTRRDEAAHERATAWMHGVDP